MAWHSENSTKNSGNDTLQFEAPFVSFTVADLNEDGTDELLALYSWYISNGDNYDVYVYELDARKEGINHSPRTSFTRSGQVAQNWVCNGL